MRGVNENPVSQALARAIVAVARTLELKVIAEGVETAEETAFLDTLGVDAKQGYLYASPCRRPSSPNGWRGGVGCT